MLLAPVYVLIGGQSTRFGSDKATRDIAGEPWALHVGLRLAGDGGDITLVGKQHPSGPLASVRFVQDSPLGNGPLAGAAAAIDDRVSRLGEGPLILASCDLVGPYAEWLTPLFDVLNANAELDAAAYKTPRGWEPFPSLLHTRWAPRLLPQIEAGCRSFQSVFQKSHVAALPWQGPNGGPPQANSPEELDEWLARRSEQR